MCIRDSSNPFPTPSTPTLLLMVRRFFVPLRTSARIRFSGIPHKPNPPIMMVAPSNTSRIASSALATTLFIAQRILNEFHHGGTETRRRTRRWVKPTGRRLVRYRDSSFFLRVSVVNLFFLDRTLPQLMRLLKFLRQLPRRQILPDMRQPLLHLPQRLLQIRLIRDRNIPPHRVR